MIYTLYVKQHNVTGLKYLGYTSKPDAHGYRGSGKHWRKHIQVHGYDVTTEIIGVFVSHDDLREAGFHYSKLWNVVGSPEWANLMEETGEGGAPGRKDTKEQRIRKREAHLGKKLSAQQRRQMSKAQLGNQSGKGNLGKKFSEEHRNNLSLAKKGRPSKNKGVPLSQETRDKLKGPKEKNHHCKACGKTMDAANYKRWHINCETQEKP